MTTLGRIASQFRQKLAPSRQSFNVFERWSSSFVANKPSNLVFRTHSMYDYRDIGAELIALCRQCESTNQTSLLNGKGSQSAALFHSEFTDYLQCMEQYSESYCHSIVDSADGKMVGVCITNVKQVHFGSYLMTAGFLRLTRVDPSRRRQNIGLHMVQFGIDELKRMGTDYCLGYTSTTHTPSLALQRKISGTIRTENYRLNSFVVPTKLDPTTTRLHKLTQTETKHLLTVDLAGWVNRPALSELRHLTQMKEYVGTFAVGDFPTGQYAVASVWQPSNMILSDDRLNRENSRRSPYRLIFNFFQSPSTISGSSKTPQMLLSALSHASAIDGIPYTMCHVEQSSPFNVLCQERAIAVTTDVMSRDSYSSRCIDVGDVFDKLPTWLDPRDFSGLLRFNAASDKVQSEL